MGLIKIAANAMGGTLADQWKEYFYCDSMPADVLVKKAGKKTSGRSGNKKGSENIISEGSVIAVNNGQCMMIVEQGKVVDLCSEPGEYTFDYSSEPSLFCGGLGEGILNVFDTFGKRFTFGGEAPKDQRVYFFNTKELVGNKYGTPSPVPFRVVDRNIGLDMDITIRCFGEYSYRIANPILFYTNVCGNVPSEYTREEIDGQLKSELMTALQPAFARISDMGIRYSSLPGHTAEMSQVLNQVLTEKWSSLRGIELVSFGVSSVNASEEDENMIKELQRSAVFQNTNMAAAHMVNAQAEAMKAAALNQQAGPAMAFMGMNMAANAGGVNAEKLFAMGQQNQQQAAQPAQPTVQVQPAAGAEDWVCSCGTVNNGKFCQECGSKRPAGTLKYRCDKCGWQPADPENPPKFCPECGDPFNDGDIVR